MVNVSEKFPEVRKWLIEAASRVLKVPVTRFGTDKTSMDIFQEGNMTVVIIYTESKRYVGYAKCNPTDRYKPEVGAKIAIYRAVRSSIK